MSAVRGRPAPLLLLLLLAFGCSEKRSAESGPKLGTITINGKVLSVEIADTRATRQKGLMNRSELAPDSGMLFIFERQAIHTFWMRNTSIPLDIAFIDRNGVITNIRQMEPFDEQTRHVASRPVPYALEVQKNWFQTRGIGPGDKVDLTGLP